MFEKLFKVNEMTENRVKDVKEDEPDNLIRDEVKAEKRVAGKIIKLSDEGWGFITSRDIKFTRIFFHWTSLKNDTLKFQTLKTGMKVEFTPIEIPEKGWRAIKISVVD